MNLKQATIKISFKAQDFWGVGSPFYAQNNSNHHAWTLTERGQRLSDSVLKGWKIRLFPITMAPHFLFLKIKWDRTKPWDKKGYLHLFAAGSPTWAWPIQV